MINAVGALGGFVAPNIKVRADHKIGSFSGGIYVLAGTTLVSAGLIALLRRVDSASPAEEAWQ